MQLDHNAIPQFTKGDEIEKLIATIVDRCSTLYGENSSYILNQIFTQKNYAVTNDKEVMELVSRLNRLEQVNDIEVDNPYSQLLELQNRK